MTDRETATSACAASDDSRFSDFFSVSPSVRYVAMLDGGTLFSRQRLGVPNASTPESDRYEELLVNPTLLALATRRGDIDCGGCDYILVRYGNFFQLVMPMTGGHVSVCIDQSVDPLLHVQALRKIIDHACRRTGSDDHHSG